MIVTISGRLSLVLYEYNSVHILTAYFFTKILNTFVYLSQVIAYLFLVHISYLTLLHDIALL